jgi:hypothetical protein
MKVITPPPSRYRQRNYDCRVPEGWTRGAVGPVDLTKPPYRFALPQ